MISLLYDDTTNYMEILNKVSVMKPFRSERLTIRGLQYHVRHWGEEGAPVIVMMHGWMDMSASFQFIVDCLQQNWHVIAPDWRGFGLTESTHADTYWYMDYAADLDALLQHYSPNAPVNLLGHSLGGNVVMLYAGIRPHRIKKLINLEGFGLPATKPEHAPQHFAKWLDELQDKPVMRTYASEDEVIARLQKTNPRLSDARAQFLAGHWSVKNADGQWEILGDPAHKMTNPQLFRIDEVLACWRAITAPVLWVEARQTDIWRWFGNLEMARSELDRRIASIGNVETRIIDNAGHMVHHDQPEALAVEIERFLLA
jgi:pimeloyl-ACP methyl ester carboxylesterase